MCHDVENALNSSKVNEFVRVSPRMTECSLCGREDLCFSCPYCNGQYCSEHRLPESHGCPGMQQARERAKKKVGDSFPESEKEQSFLRRISFPRKKDSNRRQKPRRRKRFSQTEKRDLTISAILVILVGISLHAQWTGGFSIFAGIFVVYQFIASDLWWVPVTLISTFLLAYFIHEFAHKFTAQHYGMWAEFRMVNSGYYLSAIAILFSIPIFGTGIVFTSGARNLDEEGKVNLAGPLSNFIIALFTTVIILGSALTAIMIPIGIIFIARNLIILNATLALFNMIPLGPFDGATVRRWNQRIWLSVSIGLIILLIIGYLVI